LFVRPLKERILADALSDERPNEDRYPDDGLRELPLRAPALGERVETPPDDRDERPLLMELGELRPDDREERLTAPRDAPPPPLEERAPLRLPRSPF
jgi:hypothetical protein